MRVRIQKNVEAVPLSNDVIHSRIVEMSSNVLQVVEELIVSPFPFSIQLDESTDVSQCSQLLVFVRYVQQDTRSIKEEFLFCNSLLETTKASDVFEMIKRFFIEQNGRLNLVVSAPMELPQCLVSAVIIVDASERLKSFICKLPLWKRRVESGNFANFPMFEELITQGDGNTISKMLQKEVSKHLDTLQASFEGYFNLESLENDTWVRGPFIIDTDNISDEDLITDDLIGMR
ncbi:protein ZBED8-like [Sitophilus oryzae]|uniref:Protein ZBED8-like n=1 Tax=Sitophilus oryzae TaxID=7048 RepID=A0A6J2XAG8_SITOR|nr:protein ZBED8-like [Sitophilus oryzae]